MCWFPHIDCAPVRIHKLQAAIFVSIGELVLGVSVFLGVLSWLVSIVCSCLSVGSLDQLLVEASVSNECFLGVEVLVESLSYNRVTIEADADLLEHSINISVLFLFATFIHHDDAPTSFLDVSSDILQLLGVERQPWSTQ